MKKPSAPLSPGDGPRQPSPRRRVAPRLASSVAERPTHASPPGWPEWKVALAAFWPALIIICYLGWVAIPVLVPLLPR